MTERGSYRIDRGLWGHPRLADEPFTEREAWMWMIGQAAFRPHCRRVGAVRVTLNRGELAHSLRFMADKWQWTVAQVRTFLKNLKAASDDDDPMIDTRIDTGLTVVRIRNYDAYQDALAEDRTANRTPIAQQQHKEETIDIGVGEGGSPPPLDSGNPDLSEDDLDLARAVLRARGGRAGARDLQTIAYQAALWRELKIPRSEILATVAEIASKPEQYPLSYYLTCIANRRKKRAREATQPGLPLSMTPVVVSTTEKPRDNSSTWKQAKDDFRSAHQQLKQHVASSQQLDADPREGDGGADVRLIAGTGGG